MLELSGPEIDSPQIEMFSDRSSTPSTIVWRTEVTYRAKIFDITGLDAPTTILKLLMLINDRPP